MEVLELVPEADLHVHSEWSWDASEGAMEATCRGARELGIRVVAFTEHADYSKACGGARLEVEGYLEAVESCRKSFPRLSIWTGVELGEPHRHQKEAEDVLDRGQFDLVLGSVHTVVAGGASVEISELGPEPAMDPDALMQSYCDELTQLIDGPIQFEVLAHLEYPRRYWPAGWPCYESADHWKLIQEVLAAAAHRGLVLEFNTTRGGTPTIYGPRTLLPTRWRPGSSGLQSWPPRPASSHPWLRSGCGPASPSSPRPLTAGRSTPGASAFGSGSGGAAAVELDSPERDDLLTVAGLESLLAELGGQDGVQGQSQRWGGCAAGWVRTRQPSAREYASGGHRGSATARGGA